MQLWKVLYQTLMQPPGELRLLPQSVWDEDALLALILTLAFTFACQHKT